MITFNDYAVYITKSSRYKNINITFKNNALYITCPKNTNKKFINVILENNKKDIEKLIINSINKTKLEYKKYENNSYHNLWGKRYILILEENTKNFSKIENNEILISIKNINPNNVKKELEKLYRKELENKIKIISLKLENKMNLYPKEIRIKNMKTRWGTCNTKEKRIWINLQLVKYPEECLEYVLIHEFVHLEIKNHNEHFYKKVRENCPTYKKIEQMLKNF